MKELSNRRCFLAAAGSAGLASLAGCSALSNGSTPPSGTNTTGTATQTPAGTGTEAPKPAKQSPFARGEVLEDFEDFENSTWGTIGGTVTPDAKDAYAGSQSLRLENKNGDVAGIFKAFSKGLDLTQHDLSIAVKLEKPARGKFAAEIIAPARSSMLVSKRWIPKELDGWFRIDLGYTGKQGDPVMKSVQELRLMVQTPEGEPIKFWIDDLRLIEKPKRGKVILQFDDGHVSAYTEAFKRLHERGWGGSIGVIPGTVNSDSRITMGQMREMRDAGWDMMSHPHPPSAKPLPAHSKEEQRKLIERSKKYLELKGFPKGARHFVAPYNRVNTDTIELLREYHETGFMFGACPNNAIRPSGMHTISRVMGKDPRGTRRVLNIAEDFKQMVAIQWHSIGDGEGYETSIAEFENVLDHIAQKDMDVVTPSQLIDG
jgi:peptidoglycan/xylan/chitin deacetylase (PgdA/CDA1 family)